MSPRWEAVSRLSLYSGWCRRRSRVSIWRPSWPTPRGRGGCSEDAIDNPAINLAAFLYDNYLKGRNKFSFLTPKRGRVLGLWIEQLVAESLGKNGEGILPNI